MRIELKPHSVESFPEHDFGCRAWRWVLDTDVCVGLWSVGLMEEYILLDKEDAKWSLANRYLNLAVVKEWKWGEEHFWYDGPHCAWNLGFVRIYWSGHSCKKCLDET